MFDAEIEELRSYLSSKKDEKKVKTAKYLKNVKWPSGGGKNIILKDDVGVELGSPRLGSVSFLIWTDNIKNVKDREITIVGSDIYQSTTQDLPFGKVLLIGVHGFNEDNTYDRYREMDAIRYDIDMLGYMMKGVSQYQREWSRVSIEAIKIRFSFQHLGSKLINRFKEKEFVDAVEVLFVTSCKEDVIQLQDASIRVGRVISAMNKMLAEMSFDCDTCEYIDVCDEVTELKDIRDSLESKKKKRDAADDK